MSSAFHEIKTKLVRTGEPEYFPVTLLEIKRFLNLGDTTTEDDKLEDLIPVAVEMVERHSQRALAKQAWKLYMDEFPRCPDVIELRKPPVQSVTSITYTDWNGDTQTIDAADYETDLQSAPGRIVPVTLWPDAKCIPNAVTVTFVAGYLAPVPRAAWSAIILAIRSLYYGCDVGESYQGFIDQLRWEGGL